MSLNPAVMADRVQMLEDARQALAANRDDIAAANQIITANPSPAVTELARQSRRQARQLNALIRLVLFLLGDVHGLETGNWNVADE